MNKKVTHNYLLEKRHSRLRNDLINKFTELKECSHNHYLALSRYIENTPQCFFSETVYSEYLNWLNERDLNEAENLKKYLEENEAEINRAFLHLSEINLLTWHDNVEEKEYFELIRFIDQSIHPTYLRLVEAVLCPFLKVVAHFSRLDRGKPTQGLDIYNVIEELKKSSLKNATKPYKNKIRNGIAHGGITYLQEEIKYKDKNGKEEKFYNTDVLKLFDDLLDVTNSLSLGLSVFFLKNYQKGYKLPQQLFLEELKEETKTPWWSIEGCTPSEFSNLNQLVFYVRANTYDSRKVQLSSFHTGILGEYFAPGYDRYFVSIHSRKAFPGCVAFNGNVLEKLRFDKKVNEEDYGKAIDGDLFFYVPKFKFPEVFSKVSTFYYSFKINIPEIKKDFAEKLNLPRVDVREAKMHRNSWGNVLNGNVYIEPKNCLIDKDLIRNSCASIVKKTFKSARNKTSYISMNKYLPLGYALVNVFRKNYRRRKLSNNGLSSDLVCRIRLQRIKHIKAPFLFGAEIENNGSYIIEWNKAWLEE